MASKQCIYKNCGNSSSTLPTLTYFSFPLKDQQKCQTWTQLAGCSNVNLKNKYLCEDHFNPIYLSRTPRRILLLPNAVPYAWDEHSQSKTDDSFDDEYNSSNKKLKEALQLNHSDDFDEKYIEENGDENELLYGENDDLLGQNDDLTSTKYLPSAADPLSDNAATRRDHEDDIGAQFHAKVDASKAVVVRKKYDRPPNQNNFSATTNTNHVTKRQKLQNSGENLASSKAESVNSSKDSKVTQPQKDEEDDANSNDFVIDNTENNPDITTFIYKGEEYIQMPKRIYLEQRAGLDAETKRSRKLLKKMKSLLDTWK